MVIATERDADNSTTPEKNDASNKQPENLPSNENLNNEDKKWGYDLYPERKGEKYKPGWTKIIFGFEGRENVDKMKCERNVYSCVKKSPMVKLMMGALKSSGWLDIHIFASLKNNQTELFVLVLLIFEGIFPVKFVIRQ